MTVEKLDSLEDRIQKPGYLLLLVVVLLFLIVGLVDLIDHFSNNPYILGRYDIGHIFILAVYSVATLAWASLLRRPNDDRWLTKTLDFIQFHPLLAVALIAGSLIVMAAMLFPKSPIHQRMLFFPALQATIIVFALISTGLILFYKWGDKSRPQLWRKIVVTFLGLLLVVEVVVQLLAFAGALPSLTTTLDSFPPYARVYQAEEGLGNGVTNNYGRYASEFRLLPESQRIALIGDSFIQALQVSKEENLGVGLEQKLTSGEEDLSVEVLPAGYPDYGPGMYLSNWMLNVIARDYEPDEAIIFFDLGSDFQEVDGPGYDLPYVEYVGQGRIQLNLEHFFTDLHNEEHVVYRGHEGFQLIRSIESHYLTPRLISRLIAPPEATIEAPYAAANANPDLDLDNGFVFNDATNEEALLIASSQINMANEQLGRAGADVKLVTIPKFTEAFFDQDDWNTRFGDSDLLLPEERLRRSAQQYGIPFLGLGTYMASQNLSPDEVQTLFYRDGLGHFTPAGHAFAAEAVYQCFFAGTLTAAEGCDQR